MRFLAIALLLAPTAIFAGCSPQQKVEADQNMQRAGQQARAATDQAGRAMTDAGITLRVKTAMGASLDLDTSGITVTTRNRVLYLSGSARDAQQKALAERITRATLGNKVPVVDQLAVRPPAQPLPAH